jgi:hypothetical protein
MLQAVMTEPGKIEFRQVEKPEIQDDEILMQTNHTIEESNGEYMKVMVELD